MIEHNSIRVKYLAVLIGLLRERERFLDEFSTSDSIFHDYNPRLLSIF
ncbi:hypothetical protein [Dolichospermum circinale]|jgi:hypothetical protein|nr:hypothetical protein [Dolichospermum circinale]MCE2697624.1 hypothetical protein [Anabaena sp. 49633_E8]MCE2701655.1 hypothetical protein [Anabaena sp. 49633_E8]MDB9452087.1 hypothetical protein [Dolichospermum circinale CS-547]